VQFWLFLSKLGCHGNSLGALEVLDSIAYLNSLSKKIVLFVW